MSFCHIGKISDFWIGEIKDVRIGDRRAIIIRTGEGIVAYQNECPHQGVSLCEGHLDGHTLTCPAHAWQFDTHTGQGINPRNTALKKYPLRLDAEGVWIDLDEKGPLVGPTLQADKMGRAIVAVISELNPEVTVTDRGSYLRVEAPSPCRLSRVLLERQLGRTMDFPSEIEMTMTSFKGRLNIEREQIVWSATGGTGK